MGNFWKFLTLSLIFHTLGAGFFGLNLFNKKAVLAEKGIVSVNVYCDANKTGNIKIKKITVKKKRSSIVKKIPAKKHFFSKKSVAVSENVSNRAGTPPITENRSLFYIAEKSDTLFDKERNHYSFMNASLNSSDFKDNIGIKEESEEENGDTKSLTGNKLIANLSGGVLDGKSDKRLNEIRERIEQAKRYPLLAKERGIEGTSLVRFRLRENGKLDSIQMEQSSGRRILDRESMNTVKRAAPYPFLDGWIVVPLTYEITREKQN
jgi:TonB family protein